MRELDLDAIRAENRARLERQALTTRGAPFRDLERVRAENLARLLRRPLRGARPEDARPAA